MDQKPEPFEQWLAGRDKRDAQVVTSLLSIMDRGSKPQVIWEKEQRRRVPEHLDHGGDINRYLDMKGER